MIIATGCFAGTWYSWQFARADYLFQKGTEDSVRAAVRWLPDGWQYYMRLAQFDRSHARELLVQSLRLNPFNAQADIELGLRCEAGGDSFQAEKFLLDAYHADRTYLPRWSLANYYFRHGNLPQFWTWARRAAEMPADDIRPLFELCWRVSPDPEAISTALLNDNPEMIRQYLSFLLSKNRSASIGHIARQLVLYGDPAIDNPALFAVVNQLIAANNVTAANTLWHFLMERRWVVADVTMPNNANFSRQPLPAGFDWVLPEYPGLHSWPGYSGLEVEFSGSEPEGCTIAEQTLALAPGNYTLTYAYRTSDIPANTGILWQIVDAESNTVLASSLPLSSDFMKRPELQFSIPAGNSFFRLQLLYRRAIGTPRISGTLVILSTEIRDQSK